MENYNVLINNLSSKAVLYYSIMYTTHRNLEDTCLCPGGIHIAVDSM